jgi:hypothetical protein
LSRIVPWLGVLGLLAPLTSGWRPPGQHPSDALSPPGEDYTPIISALVANGLPYVCAAFDLTERFPPLAGAAPYYEVQQPLPITTTNAGPRRDSLPLGSDIVTFPEPGAGYVMRQHR